MTELLLPKDAAEYLRTPPSTLQWWRHVGHGPCFVRIGRRVFYRQRELDEWITGNICDPSAPETAHG